MNTPKEKQELKMTSNRYRHRLGCAQPLKQTLCTYQSKSWIYIYCHTLILYHDGKEKSGKKYKRTCIFAL